MTSKDTGASGKPPPKPENQAGHAWGKPNIEGTGAGGKKPPAYPCACPPRVYKISDITDSRMTKVLSRNGIPYYRFLDEEPEDKTSGSYKLWRQLKTERDTPTQATLLREFINSPHWSAPTGVDPTPTCANKPLSEPRNPKGEDAGVGGKKHAINLPGADESDVTSKRQKSG
jgi:hypothetical protein